MKTEGVVTFAPGGLSPVEQHYSVRLDGDDTDELMFEGQIEAA